jgi:hypothetical protein
MPRRSKDEVASRARSVFDDYHDSRLAVREIAAKHGISIDQVYGDVAWWWSHHHEFTHMEQRAAKRKRKQVYDELWDTDSDELLRMLNIIGVEGVALQFGCSRFTVWRAIRGKGLRRGKDGKYVFDPPNAENPDDGEALRRMALARPRRGPSIVIIDAQVGQRTRVLSLSCPHEFERLETPDPFGIGPPQVTVRCVHCWGVKLA